MKNKIAIAVGCGLLMAGSAYIPHAYAEEPTPEVRPFEFSVTESVKEFPIGHIEVGIQLPLPPALPVITEDDPRWDCRTMGNLKCGVEIKGVWYVITFENGEPVGVVAR